MSFFLPDHLAMRAVEAAPPHAEDSQNVIHDEFGTPEDFIAMHNLDELSYLGPQEEVIDAAWEFYDRPLMETWTRFYRVELPDEYKRQKEELRDEAGYKYDLPIQYFSKPCFEAGIKRLFITATAMGAVFQAMYQKSVQWGEAYHGPVWFPEIHVPRDDNGHPLYPILEPWHEAGQAARGEILANNNFMINFIIRAAEITSAANRGYINAARGLVPIISDFITNVEFLKRLMTAETRGLNGEATMKALFFFNQIAESKLPIPADLSDEKYEDIKRVGMKNPMLHFFIVWNNQLKWVSIISEASDVLKFLKNTLQSVQKIRRRPRDDAAPAPPPQAAPVRNVMGRLQQTRTQRTVPRQRGNNDVAVEDVRQAQQPVYRNIADDADDSEDVPPRTGASTGNEDDYPLPSVSEDEEIRPVQQTGRRRIVNPISCKKKNS